VRSPAPVIRRSTIERLPLRRKPYASPPRRPVARWSRRMLLLALLPALLLGLLLLRQHLQPADLAHSELTGHRLTTGPICIEEAVDVSGSLARFQAQRQAAEDALFRFARRNLEPRDLFSEAFFAKTSTLALAPAALAGLSAPPRESSLNPDGTYLAPAVRELEAARKSTACAARALVVITDGLLADNPARLAAALRDGSYTRIFAVIPSATGWGRPAPLTGGILDSITVYHFASPGLAGRFASAFGGAKPLDVVLGDITGALTGQSLTRA
jgi:hypothetical protein